jgi:hypothetical protein
VAKNFLKNGQMVKKMAKNEVFSQHNFQNPKKSGQMAKKFVQKCPRN